MIVKSKRTGAWSRRCIKCSRTGTRGFEWIREYGWQCANDVACTARCTTQGIKFSTPVMKKEGPT